MQTPFFGIGAMRAGTSWLSQVLADHPDCGIHPIKEMHFFDVRYNIAGRNFMRNRLTQFERIVHKSGTKLNAGIDKLTPQLSKSSRALRRKNKRQQSEEAGHDLNVIGWPASPTGHTRYETVLDDSAKLLYKRIAAFAECITVTDPDSYKEFLLRYGKGSAAFGEITPAYALLPAAAFREMANLFPGAKFIFIMRDPIDRLWSQARYGAGKNSKGNRRESNLDAAFLKSLSDPQLAGRSSYHKTIETLESVVPADQILYLFYENMIDAETGPAEIRRVEHALGLRPMELSSGLFETAMNASPKSEISEANIAAAMERFTPVYQFVAERFRLPSRWRRPA